MAIHKKNLTNNNTYKISVLSIYTLKANLKKYVFRKDLKVIREIMLRKFAGSSFQGVGAAATLKDVSSNDSSSFSWVGN